MLDGRTIEEGIKNELAVLLDKVIDIAEDTTDDN